MQIYPICLQAGQGQSAWRLLREWDLLNVDVKWCQGAGNILREKEKETKTRLPSSPRLINLVLFPQSFVFTPIKM